MKSLKFFKPALATTLGILLAWLLSVRPAEAGYTVTLQQVGPDVVASGSGAIDLTGLSIANHRVPTETDIEPANGGIFTGTTAFADLYRGNVSGPRSFGVGGGGQYTNIASGDMVGIYAVSGNIVVVPTGYVSGTALSDTATWSGKTFATLGVTPGRYVWKWGTGANQNVTLEILPAILPTPTAPATRLGVANQRRIVFAYTTDPILCCFNEQVALHGTIHISFKRIGNRVRLDSASLENFEGVGLTTKREYVADTETLQRLNLSQLSPGLRLLYPTNLHIATLTIPVTGKHPTDLNSATGDPLPGQDVHFQLQYVIGWTSLRGRVTRFIPDVVNPDGKGVITCN